MSRQQTPDIMGNILAASAPAQPQATMLVLQRITNDGGTQMRAGMDPETIKEYQEAIDSSETWPFPPVIVYHDGERYWLADGFHRVNAAHRSGKYLDIPADIRAGTRRDAVLHAAGANASHGLRRTNADKRRAVETLLRDEEWRQWSDREIAKRCLVSHNLVSELRRALTPPLSSDDSQRRRIGGDGRTINTANIGARPAHQPRIFVNELHAIVLRWADEHWSQPWPENPSHTNGAFWREITTWLHANESRSWHESDLKQAIKEAHARIRQIEAGERGPGYQAVAQRQADIVAEIVDRPTPANAAAVQPERRPEMFEIEQAVRQVATAQRVAASDLRLIAKQRIGRVWQDVLKGLPANTAYRDITQACNNVAEQMTQRQAVPAPAPGAQRADTAPTAPITVNGDQPLPAWAEEPAPTAAEPVAAEAHVAPASPQADPARPWADDRTWELRRLETTLQQVLRTVGDNERRYGDLTGRHSDVLTVRHGLETMIRTCRVNQGLSD